MIFQGVPVSMGVAIGQVAKPKLELLNVGRDHIEDPEHQIERFEKALGTSKRQLERLINSLRADERLTELKIVESQRMMLDDTTLLEGVKDHIRRLSCTAEYAVSEIVDHFVGTFAGFEDEYLRERVGDVRDMGERLIRNLMGKREPFLAGMDKQAIIVVHDLPPSAAAQIDPQKVLGLATDVGGVTSHTAIISRALEIPAVVGLSNLSRRAEEGDTLILDGRNGVVILDPAPKLLKKYRRIQKEERAKLKSLAKLRNLPSETSDGFTIELAANIELLSEVDAVRAYGAQGVGLYRSEFLFLNREDLPSEGEQYEAYSVVARQLAPQPVVIRTVDIGGDKFLSHPEVPVEINPYLGCRAIRFSLKKPDTFKVQLRAILRASATGNVRLMFPMVSSLEELREAKEIVEECKAELDSEGKSYDDGIEVGIMVEVPAVAVMADQFAREVDFFSIGTNDLIQYTLAVDRGNPAISELYQPFHPAVLRLLRTIVEAGHSAGIWVGLCGEMGANPLAVPFLVGLGIDELSVSPVNVPVVKATLRAISFREAAELAAELVNLPTAEAIHSRLHDALPEEVRRFVELDPVVT